MGGLGEDEEENGTDGILAGALWDGNTNLSLPGAFTHWLQAAPVGGLAVSTGFG